MKQFQHRDLFVLTAFLCAFHLAGSAYPGSAYAEEVNDSGALVSRHACETQSPSRTSPLSPRERDNRLSLILGGSLYTPDLDGNTFAPLGALYYKHRFDDLRVRGVFSIFVNELSVSKPLDDFQLLAEIDNRTYPFSTPAIQAGDEVPGTAIRWGTVDGRLGLGWRVPIPLFEPDDDLRLQAYYQLGYLYSSKVHDTGPEVVLPPNTIVHGPLLRARYDSLHRNVMELPDHGVAAIVNGQYLMRRNGSAANYGGLHFTKAETQHYIKLSGHFLVASGLPYLSDKNRLVARINGGYAPYGVLDPMSAYRVGGGPILPDEEDFDRTVYPGAMFNQFPVYDYLISSVEYRREIFPLLYLHLRGAYTRTSRELFTVTEHGHYVSEGGPAGTVGVTSWFFGDSRLHLEYTYDTKLLRNGTSGSNIVLLWSKTL